jgi:hypothetical protein
VESNEPAPRHIASATLAATLRGWVAAQSAYIRAKAEDRGGVGSRIERMRAEVAYYDAGEALHDAVECEGLATVPDPPRPPREDGEEVARR